MKSISTLIGCLLLGLNLAGQGNDSLYLGICDPLPDKIYEQRELVFLQVENALGYCDQAPKTLGPELGKLENLRGLVYKSDPVNGDAPLPAAVGELKRLEYLKTNKPVSEIASLSALRHLDIEIGSEDELKVLRQLDLARFPQLETLAIHFYADEEANFQLKGVEALENLREVVLSSPMPQLLDQILQCAQLESLTLYQAEGISDQDFAALSKLKHLTVQRADWTSFPTSILAMNQLETLDLQDNKLTALPEGIGQLTALKSLSLANNNLLNLPESLGQCQQLEYLNLRGNDLLAHLPKSTGNLKQLDYLNASWCSLQDLPAGIGGMSNLRQLMLRKNHLRSLPDGWEQLTKLEVLELEDNRLKTIPASLFQIPNLKRIDLDDNEISEIPASIRGLASLEVLDASNNYISALPEDIGQLKKLRRLSIYNNALTRLPKGLLQATSLEVLHLSDNQI